MHALSVLLLALVAVVGVHCQWGHDKNWGSVPRESPFSPPAKTQSRRFQQRQAPQPQPSQARPSVPKASPPRKPPQWTRRPPKTQDHSHGHSHADPSAPKLSGRNAQHTKKERCGSQDYELRTHICCQGVLHKRQGIRPACCGAQVYDYVFGMCCGTKYMPRTISRPHC